MTFSSRQAPDEKVQSDSEQPRHIQPATRRRFTPARLPDPGAGLTSNSSPDPDTDPVFSASASFSEQQPGPHRPLLGGKLSLPSKPLLPRGKLSLPSKPLLPRGKLSLPSKKNGPRLHPALQDVEQQETRAIPQFSPPTLLATENAGSRQSGASDAAADAALEPRLWCGPVEDAAGVETDEALEVVNGHVVLYRQANFSVHTVYRPGQKLYPLRKPSGYTSRMARVMPHQRERVAVSQTRRMPRVEMRETRRSLTLPVPLWLESAALLLLLAGAVYLHAYNLFQFPGYTMDEGTYMQNAWAITIGKLSPYPYGYGHPPAGWIQLALWIKVSNLFRFGAAINSGRIMMLAYSAGGTLLVYLIARRLGGSKSAALIGMALFASSPLSVILQREVLLDNIATFWLLLALYLIVVSRSRLLYLAGAALALGLAVLSKEVSAVLLPALAYLAWLHITPFQRKFALVTFTYITLAMISTFVLMALLKGELFPYAWHLPWDTHPHLSLLDTYAGQIQRGQNQGSFLESWRTWWQEDAPLTCAGLAAPIFNLLYGWRERKHLALALLALSYWLLLARGGVVYVFYLLPLLPLIALNVALALHVLLGWLSRLARLPAARAVLLLLLLSLLLPYNAIGAARQASAQPVAAQQQALSWVRAHLPRNAYIVIDTYMYLDLRQPANDGANLAPVFTRAEVYWNVATDPSIRDGVLHNSWNNIDYLVVDKQMLDDIHANTPAFTILQAALVHSTRLASFHARDYFGDITLQIYQVRHQNTPLVRAGPTKNDAQTRW
ncbi:MAG TPA: glycosyltransferase family 39 protein [Ktedonobacteraceae bacterium]